MLAITPGCPRSPAATITPGAASTPAGGLLPIHGLPDLDRVCDVLVPIVDDETGDAHDCEPLSVGADGSWALFELYGVTTFYIPVIRTGGGWSAMRPMLDAWDSGTEFNILFEAARLDTWVGPAALGELLVFELEGKSVRIEQDRNVEEPHRRVVICAREANQARCTPPIFVHIERELVPHYEYDKTKRLPKHSYEAKLRVKGEDLVVAGPSVKGRVGLEPDAAIFLAAGRYALAELLTRETSSVYFD